MARSFCNNILTYGTDIKQSNVCMNNILTYGILILNKEKQSESSMKSIKVIPPRPIEDSISSINANPERCYFYNSNTKRIGISQVSLSGKYYVKWSNSSETIHYETFNKLVEVLTSGTEYGYNKITVHQITE